MSSSSASSKHDSTHVSVSLWPTGQLRLPMASRAATLPWWRCGSVDELLHRQSFCSCTAKDAIKPNPLFPPFVEPNDLQLTWLNPRPAGRLDSEAPQRWFARGVLRLHQCNSGELRCVSSAAVLSGGYSWGGRGMEIASVCCCSSSGFTRRSEHCLDLITAARTTSTRHRRVFSFSGALITLLLSDRRDQAATITCQSASNDQILTTFRFRLHNCYCIFWCIVFTNLQGINVTIKYNHCPITWNLSVGGALPNQSEDLLAAHLFSGIFSYEEAG